MSGFEAFLIGLLQGLTEFLPISSSAHLKLAKIFLGIQEQEGTVFFDLACHLGTLVAILFFLRRDIFQLFMQERKKLYLLFFALLPLIPSYFLLKPLRDWASAPERLGFFLLLTSGILFMGSRLRLKKSPSTTFKGQTQEALWIGTLQSMALIPGISRSASTISCANVLGWSAKEAVRFSFLLSIPTVLGGSVLELFKFARSSVPLSSLSFSSCLIGFTSSCMVGLIVIRLAIGVLERGYLRPFAWYCLSLGLLTSLYLNLF